MPQNYLLIIEELNRGNAYEILGNAFQLLDRDKDGGVTLQAEEADWFKLGENGTLVLPDNFYIVCTMNNADSNVCSIDSAFRRRFKMAYMDYDGNLYSDSLNDIGYDEDKLINSHSVLRRDEYNRLRKCFNDLLSDYEYISDDKMLTEYYIRFSDADTIGVVDFIVTMGSYIVESVLRGRDMTGFIGDGVLNGNKTTTIGRILDWYRNDIKNNIDAMWNDDNVYLNLARLFQFMKNG